MYVLVNKYFNDSLGFSEHKQTAIDLLSITTKILDEFNIEYFLISGTLLGYIRHNDFKNLVSHFKINCCKK